ncbi:MAG: dNTP triphosphohydrolase [Rhodospirillales bacterium]|nr:dNTP triphosphohydrolase [Rhodospirillales bacterium]
MSPMPETQPGAPLLAPSWAPRPWAPYACDPARSRGRLYPEPESLTRSPFQRDRDRIVHSGAFRKLKHKTQVFVYHEGDYYRTRLTHSIEVAQIARTVARHLALNEDLAECVALAHDLGHTPFGHAGEDALAACMEAHGGFDHNDQALRILTQIEHRYAAFDGLNLTWETIEGLVKHNGPVKSPYPTTLQAFRAHWDLELDAHAGLEAQVAAISDDIAYNTHDIDDGLRAGFITVAEMRDLPLVGPILNEVLGQWPGLEQGRLIHETTRRMIDRMVNDILAETRRRLDQLRPASAEAVRAAGRPMVTFSDEMQPQQQAVRKFLYDRVYRDFRVNRMRRKVRGVLTDLFDLYMDDTSCLSPEWRAQAETGGATHRARTIADYVAGMTDRFAIDEHRRLFDPYHKI